MGCQILQAEIKPFEPDPDNAGVGKKSYPTFFIFLILFLGKMRCIISFLCLILYPVFVFGQVNVNGVVLNDNNEPMVGANVIFENTYYGVSTDFEGKFTFSNVPAGDYNLKVSYIGYEAYAKKMQIGQHAEQVIITLSSSDILADEVVVKSTRASSDMPLAYSDIDKEEIEKRNLGQDMPYLLKMNPSTVVSSDAGTGIGYTSFRIRGTDMNRINVTVNGIPLNDPESHGTWWVDLPDFASGVDNIQIQRGVGTSTNGAGAFGASVNLQTFKLRKDPYAELNSSAGSFRTFKNNVLFGSGLINGKFSFDARFSKVNSDGFIDRAFADLASLSLSGAYYGNKSIFKLIYISGKERTYQAWDGVPGYILDTNRTYNGIGQYTDKNGVVRYYDNETDNYWQDHLQAFYSKEFNHNLFLNLAFHYTKGKGYYEQYKEMEDFEDYGMDNVIVGSDTITSTDMIRQKWLDNDFYGLTYALNYRKKNWDLTIGGALNKYWGNHFGKVIWTQVAEKGDYQYEWYRSRGIKTDFNIYGKAGWKPGTKLNLFGDLQIRQIWYNIDGIDDDLRDLTQEYNYLFFNPKFGVNYKISNNHRAYFSFSIANREPSRSNLIDADPAGPVPTYETLYDYELGYGFSSRRFAFDANVYFMDYTDQLVLTGEINDVGAPVMTNVEDSYRLGLEVVAGFIISSKIKWELNATISRNKILDYTEYVDDWDTWSQRSMSLGTTDLSFSPALVAGNSISYEPISNLNIAIVSKYVGKQYIDNTSNEKRILNPYLTHDLSVQYSIYTNFIPEISLNFLLNNFINASYETNAWVYRYYYQDVEQSMDGFFPQAGIHFLFGLKLRF